MYQELVIHHLKILIMTINFPNGGHSYWNDSKPVRILLTGMLQGEVGTLTGHYEIQNVCGEPIAMLEVSHPFGTDMIFEDYLSQ